MLDGVKNRYSFTQERSRSSCRTCVWCGWINAWAQWFYAYGFDDKSQWSL